MKKIKLILTMTLMMLLSGCVNIDMTLDLEKDGSGKIITEVLMQEDLMGEISEEDIKSQYPDYESFEIIEKEGKKGYKITSKVISENDTLTEDEVLTMEEDLGYKVDKKLFTITESININLKELLLGEMSAEDMQMISFIGGTANIGFHIKTPNEFETNNATSITEDGDKIVYNWDYTLDNVGEISISYNSLNMINVGILSVLIIGIIAGLVAVLKKRKTYPTYAGEEDIHEDNEDNEDGGYDGE